MKKTILVMGIIASIFGLTSCLDNEDMDLVPAANEHNHSFHGKDGDEGNDSIPPPPPPAPPTGGETGQIPVKP